MANTGSGFGFTEFGWPDGNAPTAGQTTYTIRSSNATAIGNGDVVILSSGDPGVITRGTTTQAESKVLGVFVGCKYYSPTVGRMVWNNQFPGSVATSCGTADVTAYVVDDPNSFFLVRGGSVAFTAAMVGLNVGTFSSYTLNTVTGVSQMRADAGTVTGNASCPFRIADLYRNHAPPGAEGTDAAANNIIVVAPNNWVRKTLTGLTT